MAVNLPNSPTNGQTATAGGQTLVWNATAGVWNIQAGSGGGGASVELSDSAPSSPSSGDMWFNTTNLKMYVYYVDTDGAQWIQTTSDAAVENATPSDTAPTNPSSGDIWFDTTGLNLYVYYSDGDSNQWVQMNSEATSTPTIPSDVSDLTDSTGLLSSITQSDIDTSISNLVDSAPATLNTLNELAAALGDDANFATTITNQIAAAGGSKVDIVATGTIADGDTCIVRTDGTTEKISSSVTETLNPAGASWGSSYSTSNAGVQVGNTNEWQDVKAVFDPVTNSFVVVGVDTSHEGKATTGQVNADGSITMSNTTIDINPGGTGYISDGTLDIVWDTQYNKAVVVYALLDGGDKKIYSQMQNNVGYNNLSFQSRNELRSTSIADNVYVEYDETANMLVLVYTDRFGSGTALGVFVNAYSSNGSNYNSSLSEITISTEFYDQIRDITYNPNVGKCVILWQSGSDSTVLNANMITISSGTLSATSAVRVAENQGSFTLGGGEIKLAYHPPTGKMHAFFTNNFNYLFHSVLTVTSTSITVLQNIGAGNYADTLGTTFGESSWNNSYHGRGIVWNSSTSEYNMIFRGTAGASGRYVLLAFDNADSTTGTIGRLDASGLGLTPIALSGTYSNNPTRTAVDIIYDTNRNKSVLFFSGELLNNGNTVTQTRSYDKVVTTNLTAQNFLGISNGAYTNGQTATIQTIGSVDDAQSGLTPGTEYYIQNNGTLATGAGNPSVKAGLAISATNLLIRN